MQGVAGKSRNEAVMPALRARRRELNQVRLQFSDNFTKKAADSSE